jgi:hypothetical protein
LIGLPESGSDSIFDAARYTMVQIIGVQTYDEFYYDFAQIMILSMSN